MIEVIVATIARIRPRTQAAPEGHYSLGSDSFVSFEHPSGDDSAFRTVRRPRRLLQPKPQLDSLADMLTADPFVTGKPGVRCARPCYPDDGAAAG